MTSLVPRSRSLALLVVSISLHAPTKADAQDSTQGNGSFRLEELFQVGTTDSLRVEDPERFYLVAGALLDSKQNLLVLDAGQGRIQLFRRDGSYQRTLGFGIGPNPGRFMMASSIAWLAEDSLVAILDRHNSTVTVFHTQEGLVERVNLTHALAPVWSLVSVPGVGFALSAFAREDSTTLQILSRHFVRMGGARRWPVERNLILLNRLGGGFVAARRSNGIVLAERNPGRLVFFDAEGIPQRTITLDEFVPAGDSTVFRRGPGGRPMVAGFRVPEITGLSVVSDSVVLLSTSVEDRVGARFLLVHSEQGVIGSWESRDAMRILGGNGRYVVMWLNIGGEFVGVYELKGVL